MKRAMRWWMAAGVVSGGFVTVVEACSAEDPGRIDVRDSGVSETSSIDTGAVETSSSGPRATATILRTADAATLGTATFVEDPPGTVSVSVSVSNVPAGLHGVHVHANGSCEDAGNAAGGHFNPTDAGHGYPTAATHHAGDLGNLSADGTGSGSIELTSTTMTVAAGPLSVVNRAIIVHAGADDGITQPTGDSGARLGCGVISAQ